MLDAIVCSMLTLRAYSLQKRAGVLEGDLGSANPLDDLQLGAVYHVSLDFPGHIGTVPSRSIINHVLNYIIRGFSFCAHAL